MNYNFKPKFVFNKDVPYLLKQMMIKEFVRLRNFAVNEMNPLFEQWNEEYEKIHPGYDGINDSGYLQFIADKEKPIIDKVNSRKLYAFTYLDLDPVEKTDIIGRSEIGGITVKLFLEPA